MCSYDILNCRTNIGKLKKQKNDQNADIFANASKDFIAMSVKFLTGVLSFLIAEP